MNFTSISGDQTIVADWDYNNNGRSFQLRWDDDTTDTLEFHVCGDGSTIKENTANWTPVVGRWYHLTATYNAGTTKLYIDGISQTVTADASQPTSLHSSSDPILIGSTGDATTRTNYFNGKISNLSLYKTALDAQTIKQFAKSRFTPIRENRFSVVDFDGTNDYIESSSNVGITGASQKSGCAWINPTAVDDHGVIFDWGEASAGKANQLKLFEESANTCKLRFDANGTNATGTTVFAVNTWYHVAFTYDADKIRVYVDGVLEATSSSITCNSTDSTLIIGNGQPSNNQRFTGLISSVSIYNTAKSADEVYAIYQQGITYDESSLSGLVGYWRMGDDTSKAYPTIADSSSNSNDGTITNGASDDIVQQMVAGWDMGAFERYYFL